MWFPSVAALLILLPGAPAKAAPVGGLAAREQVRLCVATGAERSASLAACRRALELGLGPDWSAAIRLLMARQLGSLARWDEVVETYGELAAARPEDGRAQLRLGAALLLGRGLPEQALGPLSAATGLAPSEPDPWALLAAAHNALGRHPEAVAAMEEALRRDPRYLDSHPASAELYEASKRGNVWPPAPAPQERP